MSWDQGHRTSVLRSSSRAGGWPWHLEFGVGVPLPGELTQVGIQVCLPRGQESWAALSGGSQVSGWAVSSHRSDGTGLGATAHRVFTRKNRIVRDTPPCPVPDLEGVFCTSAVLPGSSRSRLQPSSSEAVPGEIHLPSLPASASLSSLPPGISGVCVSSSTRAFSLPCCVSAWHGAGAQCLLSDRELGQ